MRRGLLQRMRQIPSAVRWLVAGREVSQPTAAPTYGIRIGERSVIYPPRRVDGASYISVGDQTTISPGAWLGVFGVVGADGCEPRLLIGSNVYIGHFACITAALHVAIGDGCVLSEFVYISDHWHGFEPDAGPIIEQALVTKGQVVVGRDCFLGYQSCILPGVSLGRNCVVGANSVVTHSFPEYCMVAGAPARLIKRYSIEGRAWVPAADGEARG